MMKKLSLSMLILMLTSQIVLAGDPNHVAETRPLDVVGGHMQLPQFGGFRNGTYLNIQTRTSSYAYWGLLRWDITHLKEQFNAHLGGLGNWKVTKVELEMVRTRYTHSNSGNVDVRFTTDNQSDFYQMANLTDGASDPIGGQLEYGIDPNGMPATDGVHLTTIYYEDAGTNYVPLRYTLYDSATDELTPVAEMFLDSFVFSDKTTLAFVDSPTDFMVSAAWAGPDTTYYGQQPKLIVTAEATESFAVCANPPLADFTGDCKVGLADFAIFAGYWLECGYANPADCY